MDKIKVAISAIWYPMAMATYFWRAFKRREDVELFVVGPFTGDWIPWAGGMHLPQKYVVAPDLALPPELIGRGRPSPNLVNAMLPWTPDLFIQFDAGFHYDERPRGGVVAHVQTDPHVLKDFYMYPKNYSDLNFCMQYGYMKEREVFLPYAYDPTVHYPMPEVEKIYDACLLGLHYDTRNSLVGELGARGIKVRYGIGEIFDEFRLAYNQSRVALSWASLLDIPARVFEAMGMGLPLVANRLPDMGIFFKEGEHYLGFSDAMEGADQVQGLLRDDNFRNELARKGHENVVNRHTWDVRVNTILEEAGLL